VLIAAPGENPRSPEYQQELLDLSLSWTRANVNYSARGEIRESIGGGSVFDGNFWIEVLKQTIPQILGGAGATGLGIWLTRRSERRFTVERNGVKKVCRTVEEAHRALDELEQLEKNASGPKVTLHER
jgi:hypothetical protein